MRKGNGTVSVNVSLQSFAEKANLSISDAYTIWHARNIELSQRWREPATTLNMSDPHHPVPHVTTGGGALGLTPADVEYLKRRRGEPSIYDQEAS